MLQNVYNVLSTSSFTIITIITIYLIIYLPVVDECTPYYQVTLSVQRNRLEGSAAGPLLVGSLCKCYVYEPSYHPPNTDSR